MLRSFSFSAIAGLLLLFPAPGLAGGPPWLCLPIDGVTPANAQTCADLLTARLEDKLWPHPGRAPGVRLQQHASQWYLTFFMGEDVGLSDVEAALRGSGFAIPRDKLRFFGHVILEIDPAKAPVKELLADLEAIDQVSVAETESKDGLLRVTVDMPYPLDESSEDGSLGWDTFQRSDFSSDQATRSEPPVTAGRLPGDAAFRDILARHKASQKEVRWSTSYACRALGCVVAPHPT